MMFIGSANRRKTNTQENIMSKREQHQWALYNLAEIGRNPEIYETKEEALADTRKYSENESSPFIRVDEQNKWIDYRGKVLL
jgi:hypothetical protein